MYLPLFSCFDLTPYANFGDLRAYKSAWELGIILVFTCDNAQWTFELYFVHVNSLCAFYFTNVSGREAKASGFQI